jgi:hypothetical protein
MSGGLTLGRSAEGRDARAVIGPSLHQLAPLPAPISALCASADRVGEGVLSDLLGRLVVHVAGPEDIGHRDSVSGSDQQYFAA